MNILFLLYGDLSSNTSYPLKLICSELESLGHNCIISTPEIEVKKNNTDIQSDNVVTFEEILNSNGKIFPNSAVADIIHASTSRLVIFNFLRRYQSQNPVPLVFCVEDNERWLIKNYLDLEDDKILGLSNKEILSNTPKELSNYITYPIELALADLVICLHDKLKQDIPDFIYSESISWPANITLFTTQESLPYSKEFFGIAEDSEVIVYHGGLNGFNRSALMDLCRSIDLINQEGISCYLIRMGPNKFNFISEMNLIFPERIIDYGVVDREDLPKILSLATLFIQPGRINEYEDLRLPSKVLDFLSMGKPVLMPNVNIAHQFVNGVDAVILNSGEPREIADSCIALFNDRRRMQMLGKNARRFALKNFSPQVQASKFEAAYRNAISIFDPEITKALWSNLNVSNLFTAIAIKITALVHNKKVDMPLAISDLIYLIEVMNKRIKNLSDRVDDLILKNSEIIQTRSSNINNVKFQIFTKVLNFFK